MFSGRVPTPHGKSLKVLNFPLIFTAMESLENWEVP